MQHTDDYYDHTTGIVKDQLRKRLVGKLSDKERAQVWQKWINNWCQFTFVSFLKSNIVTTVTQLLDRDYQEEISCSDLNKLVPWPDEAVAAYSVYTYTEQLDQSLVQYLRDDLGIWWSANMHHIDGGMSKFPEAFTKRNKHGWNKTVHLYDNITINVTVNEIDFTAPENGSNPNKNHVVVKGYNLTSEQPFMVEGDVVIITTPLHIIRQMKIQAEPNTETHEIPTEIHRAIEDIWYGPSTKIMLQFRTKFWEKNYGIKGGFSKTNLPVGQIHYPTSTTKDCSTSTDGPGILLCYTWKAEALLFGSLSKDEAIREALREIAEVHVHENVQKEFETGAVQAWYNDPAAQGAYALLKPDQFKNVMVLTKPWRNIYFAGEGISFASGWIQGALESGLRAAYQFFAHNEHNS